MATSIAERFAAQAERTPDAVAVSSGATRLTYRELDERANRLAHRLLGLGVAAEHPVAILQERSVDLVVSILAAVKAGAFYLPLHSAYPTERMQWIMDRSGAAVLLADQVMHGRGLPVAERTVLVDAGEEAPADAPGVTVHPDQLAYVMYTSGSTGQPKGVAITHRDVLRLVDDQCWGGSHTRVPMLAPYAFDVSTYELWVPLLRGGEVVLAPPGDLDVAVLRRLVRDEGIETLHLTAGLFRLVAEEEPECLAGVREVMTGGDVISPRAVARVLAACPDLTVRAMYGPTESTLFTTQVPIRAPYEPGATVPVGAAMDGVRVYVLDENLAPASDGELYIAGGRLARGYHGRPELTAERFVADPFGEPGDRMYRTGDIVRWTDDGLVDFVGRSDDQVKIRGFRVELAEVESVLAAHPSLAHVSVIAREITPGEKMLAAYVVPGSAEVDTAALRAHATESLPEYMVPAAFVVLDTLPLTANGKVDRAALPAPDLETVSVYRAPRTEAERLLCELFADVLAVPRVGVDDDFFDLGGQSLLAMRLVNRIQTTFGVPLQMRVLFDASTVAELAGHVTAGPAADVPIKRAS
jgi:amino acid adenylation domain-containing protein